MLWNVSATESGGGYARFSGISVPRDVPCLAPAAQEPPKQLKGYATVNLAPGQSRLVLFRLRPSDLAYYNQSSNAFIVAPGSYTVLVGTSSTELDHAASFKARR